MNLSRQEFRIDIGRADQGRTFVRVVHMPSGKERIQVGLDGSTTSAVSEQLMKEVAKELGAILQG